MMQFGLNLYSVRNHMQSEAEFLDTAIRLREMGYASLQFSGIPYDAGMIARVSAESGMPIVLTHSPLERIIHDTDALMEEHLQFECRNIGLGYLAPKIIADETACKTVIAQLERAAEKMAENGFAFFYHNHQNEFYQHGGQTVFAYMIENAPHFNFTLDTYWLQYGGVDILAWIKKLKGRIACVHLKDYQLEPLLKDGEVVDMRPRYAPVGDGTIDFRAIIPQMLTAGTEHFLVEQDNAALLPDTFGQVKRSIDYLMEEF